MDVSGVQKAEHSEVYAFLGGDPFFRANEAG